jgi:hypothetical protein
MTCETFIAQSFQAEALAALVAVVEDACERWRVPYFACRGNNSKSEQYAAGRRFADRFTPIVLHLGDHDPSGLDRQGQHPGPARCLNLKPQNTQSDEEVVPNSTRTAGNEDPSTGRLG